jgi:hypothetical protein
LWSILKWNCLYASSLSSCKVNVSIQDKLLQLSGKMRNKLPWNHTKLFSESCLEKVRELYPELITSNKRSCELSGSAHDHDYSQAAKSKKQETATIALRNTNLERLSKLVSWAHA